jgi:hypothetical protein
MSKQDTHRVEQSGTKALGDTGEDVPLSGHWTLLSGRHVQFWLFCTLLGLALISMGVTQATEGGGALYWLILLWVYALVSLTPAWIQARKRNDLVWRQIRSELLHSKTLEESPNLL